MANLGVNIDAMPYASMAPIDHSELRFDGAFAKAASGYKDGWHDDWRSMIQCEEEVLGRCGSVKRCRLLATDYHALAVQQHSVCSPAPFRDDSRAATTEKTCILGEKFLMSPQSELTISNS
ncbi:hypothetical protein PI125_g8736 [Phytophthora idaei]|nr:hypothetical protein PI125_g8736 [Phytophthora idaei]